MSDSDVIHSDYSSSSNGYEEPAEAKPTVEELVTSVEGLKISNGEETRSDYSALLKEEDEEYESKPELGEQTTCSNGSGESFIESLPDQVLWQILKHQEDRALKTYLLVSKRFKQIINKKRLNHLKKADFYECRIKQCPEEIHIEVKKREELESFLGFIPMKTWSCVLKLKEQLDPEPSHSEGRTLSHRNDYRADEETVASRTYNDVSSFYASEEEDPYDVLSGCIRVNTLEEGLEEHLTYVCRRVNFGLLHLV